MSSIHTGQQFRSGNQYPFTPKRERLESYKNATDINNNINEQLNVALEGIMSQYDSIDEEDKGRIEKNSLLNQEFLT